ncbi:hypothetical protein GQ457_16G021360 [Hibiscus cannabinus]
MKQGREDEKKREEKKLRNQQQQQQQQQQEPILNTNSDTNLGLIHLLPTFHGLPSENPHKHLTEFLMVCSSMKPHGVFKDKIKLYAFPFSLPDIFPAAKESELRRSILEIGHKDNESLYDYWE